MTRLFVAGLLCLGVVSATASAQRTRGFEDSWFWGVKAGVSSFSPTYGASQTAATYGVEWLITRTNAALYISADEANIDVRSGVFDPSADNSIRDVQVDKLRRIGFAALAFPKRFGALRPYAGLGLTINIVGDAYPLITAEESDVDDVIYERIDERRSQAAVLAMGGVQAQFGRMAAFGQATYIPSNSRFLLRDALGFFEVGVRYNLSSSRAGIR